MLTIVNNYLMFIVLIYNHKMEHNMINHRRPVNLAAIAYSRGSFSLGSSQVDPVKVLAILARISISSVPSLSPPQL